MRNFILGLAALGLAVAIVNCQPNNGRNSNNGNNGNVAVTPAPPPPQANCLFNNYNNGGYNYGNNYQYPYGGYPNNGYPNGGYQCQQIYGGVNGFVNYPYDYAAAQNHYQGGFCQCPAYYRPIYNNNWGMGCVDGRFLNYTNSYYVAYAWDYTNMQWLNISQVPTNTANAAGTCYNDSLLACDTSNPGTCGTAGTCFAINGGRIGVCQYQGGYNGYNNWYNGGNR